MRCASARARASVRPVECRVDLSPVGEPLGGDVFMFSPPDRRHVRMGGAASRVRGESGRPTDFDGMVNAARADEPRDSANLSSKSLAAQNKCDDGTNNTSEAFPDSPVGGSGGRLASHPSRVYPLGEARHTASPPTVWISQFPHAWGNGPCGYPNFRMHGAMHVRLALNIRPPSETLARGL